MGKKTKSKAETAPQAADAKIDDAGAAEARVPQTPEEQIASLEARCAELDDKAMRSMADYKNLRKRMFADSEAAVLRQLQPMLEELLFVLDFLDMALASTCESQDAKNLAMGVQMTRTKFAQVLEASDVKEIGTDGLFDPSLHDAKGAREEPGAEEGQILEVQRRGYTWQSKVLRPAQVIVAAAPNEAESEAE